MREMREIISHYWGKEIQLETPEGHLGYLRSSLGSQFSNKKNTSQLFLTTNHLPKFSWDLLLWAKPQKSYKLSGGPSPTNPKSMWTTPPQFYL